MFGPTGPTGAAGAPGPQGITGQYGPQGWRGFPGRPAKPVQVQILQCLSDNVINTGQVFDYPLNYAIPALSGNASTTISGLTITNLTSGLDPGKIYTDVQIPAGTYYIEAAAGVSQNVYDATSTTGAQAGLCYLTLRDICGNSNVVVGTSTYAPNTGYFSGYLSNTVTCNYNLRQTLVGVPSGSHGLYNPLKGLYDAGCLVNPQFFQSNYGYGNAPTGPPPTVTFTIMKIA